MEKEKGESMVLDESFELYNGVTIPKIGLGTWFIDDDKAAQAVKAAVDFEISDEDMQRLQNIEHIKDYGEFSHFPVFSGK